MAILSPLSIVSTVAIGLVLATAFQLLLASLGIAAGLSAAPLLVGSSNSKDGGGRLGGIGIGLGLLVTVNLVLFGACYLAIKLNFVGHAITGAIVGLVIWSVYWLLLLWLSSRTVGSLVGTIAGFLTGGMQQLFSTLQSLWRSDETADSLLEDLKQQIESLRHELVSPTSSPMELITPGRTDTPSTAANAALNGVQTQLMRSVKPAIAQQVDTDTVVEKRLQPIHQWATNIPQRESNGSSKNHANRQQYGHGTAPVPSLTKWNQSELWQTFGDYIRDANHSLKQKEIKQYLKQLAVHANAATTVTFDRKMVKSWLAERSDLSQKQIQKLTNRLEKSWEKLEWSKKDEPENSNESDASTKVSRLQVLHDAMSNLELPSLENEHLKQNLHQVLTASQAKLRDLKAAIDEGHLQEMKPETLIALLPSSDDLSDLAQPIKERVVAAREELLQQLEHLQQQANQRVVEVKHQAQQQTATTVRNVAIAAWWLFGVALTSALTSALAGVIAIH